MSKLNRINWKYALGEVIIVIIGISIAFSLNQWAENNKNRNIRQQYLQSLIADIDSETEHLQNNIEAFEQKIQQIQRIMPYLYGLQNGRDTIAMKIFSLAEIVHFKPQDVTYKTLINSGDLGLFNDFELKKRLEDYYSSHESIRMDYERQHNINEKYFADFMIYNVEFDEIRKGDYSFMDDKLLKSIVQSLYGTYGFAIQASRQGMERARQTKDILSLRLK